MVRAIAFLSCALTYAFGATDSSAGTCRQALALGLDVSGSVDSIEYRQQLYGLATALSQPSVQDVLLRSPQSPVLLTVYEWSGPDDQALIAPWTKITSHEVLTNFIDTLKSHNRTPRDPATSIGSAIQFGAQLLNSQECWVKTLDISGDGKSNVGPAPKQITEHISRDITVNALIIGPHATKGTQRITEINELVAYYQANVITPEIGFTETAVGFENYVNAMERKLLRELQGQIIGEASQ